MKKIYQAIRLLKLQIISSISNHASPKTSGFPIFLALIMFLIMPPLVPQEILPTTLFQSTNDSFRVGVPEGWVIHDVNNTSSMVVQQESTQGYGILAQICLAEEGEERGQQQQQEGALTNVSTTSSCQQQQQAQEEIIHIIRYPNLGTRLGIAADGINDIIPDSVLVYQIQKLQEVVGYRDIKTVNSADTRMLAYDPTTPDLLGTLPAKFVQMTYNTDSAPSEIRTGYLFLTASNAVPPNLQTITGYSIFYEGGVGATTVAAEETTRSENLPPLSSAAEQILNSFGPIPLEEAVQFASNERAQQAAVSNQADNAGEESNEPKYAIQYLDAATAVMLIIYSLLVIGVVWKFISYMREKPMLKIE
jgi:hypothetical protein